MQENILEAYPEEDIQVYAVWFNVLAGDHSNAWDPNLLPDERVKHYWDQDRVTSLWFSENGYFDFGLIAWDVYYLFGPESEWGPEVIGPLTSSGYTIIRKSEDLREAVKQLMDN